MKMNLVSVVSSISLILLSFPSFALRCDRVVARGLQLDTSYALVDIREGTLSIVGPAGALTVLSAETVNPYDRVAVDFDRALECRDASSVKADGAGRMEIRCSADGGQSTAKVDLTVARDGKSASYRGAIVVTGYEEFDFSAEFSSCHD